LSRERVIKRTSSSCQGSSSSTKFRARRRGSKDLLLLVILSGNCHIPAKIHGQERGMFETNNNPPRKMRGRGSKGKYEKVKEIKESKGRKERKSGVLLCC
jgi:hypothetical protein